MRQVEVVIEKSKKTIYNLCADAANGDFIRAARLTNSDKEEDAEALEALMAESMWTLKK